MNFAARYSQTVLNVVERLPRWFTISPDSREALSDGLVLALLERDRVGDDVSREIRDVDRTLLERRGELLTMLGIDLGLFLRTSDERRGND